MLEEKYKQSLFNYYWERIVSAQQYFEQNDFPQTRQSLRDLSLACWTSGERNWGIRQHMKYLGLFSFGEADKLWGLVYPLKRIIRRAQNSFGWGVDLDRLHVIVDFTDGRICFDLCLTGLRQTIRRSTLNLLKQPTIH